ncbi:MAG: acyl-CoA thioesterase [Vicinamibacteria bacterium]
MPETICQIRVRYAETDGMGVVYYGNYLTWFEVGRTDLMRQLGESYREIEEKESIHLPVVEAHCRYHRPARYDDVVDIVTRASRPSRARIRFDYELSRAVDGTLLASGTTLHVAVGRDGKPCRLPPKLQELLG